MNMKTVILAFWLSFVLFLMVFSVAPVKLSDNYTDNQTVGAYR